MRIAVIGGGASGMVAALSAAENAEVTIFEHMQRMGKKLLLTGSGRCNISNADMDMKHFHSGNASIVESVLKKCPQELTLSFFEDRGLYIKDKRGYLYPYSESASAVLDVLRFAIRDTDIDVLTDTDIRHIESDGIVFTVTTNDVRFEFDRVILCCGSNAARNTGSDGSGYSLAKNLGHEVIKPLPALTNLKCEEDWYPSIAGIRTGASISIFESLDGNHAWSLLGSEEGELQFTKAGISGIAVFNLSHMAVKSLDQHKKVKAVIDLLPEISQFEIHDFLRKRIDNIKERTAEELFIGLLAKPLGICICKRCGIDLRRKCSSLSDDVIVDLGRMVKDFETVITSSGGFEECQCVQGGVSLNEVDENLESRIVPGLYFAGEILDVNGDCGGYNLQWAASSGMLAGREAAK